MCGPTSPSGTVDNHPHECMENDLCSVSLGAANPNDNHFEQGALPTCVGWLLTVVSFCRGGGGARSAGTFWLFHPVVASLCCLQAQKAAAPSKGQATPASSSWGSKLSRPLLVKAV